jgi:hypothetical protein
MTAKATRPQKKANVASELLQATVETPAGPAEVHHQSLDGISPKAPASAADIQ